MTTGTQEGQRVVINPSAHEELTWQQLGRSYTVLKVIGDGDGAMCSLKDGDGQIVKWIRADEFLPAPTDLKPSERPRVVEREKPMSMSSLETQMLTLTAEYQKKFNLTAAAAAKRASGDLLTTPEKANAYLGHRVAHEPLPSPDERSVRAELARVQTEENCSASEAAAIIIARADAARFSQHVHNLQLSGLDATTALMRAQHDDPQGATAWREAGVN